VSQTWGIIGVRTDYDAEDQGVTWANFHNEGARLVCAELGLDPYGGELRAPKLAELCRAALAIPGMDPGVERRVRDLVGLAASAGDLGRIWYG